MTIKYQREDKNEIGRIKTKDQTDPAFFFFRVSVFCFTFI